MRYFLLPTLVVLSLSAAPVQAISGWSTEPCAGSAGKAELAQARCYQVADYFPPDMMNCQRVGQTQLGIPIWLCCN